MSSIAVTSTYLPHRSAIFGNSSASLVDVSPPALFQRRHRVRPRPQHASDSVLLKLPSQAVVVSSAEARALLSGRISRLVRPCPPRLEGQVGIECGGYVVATAEIAGSAGPLLPEEFLAFQDGCLRYEADEVEGFVELWVWELGSVTELTVPYLLPRRSPGFWCHLHAEDSDTSLPQLGEADWSAPSRQPEPVFAR